MDRVMKQTRRECLLAMISALVVVVCVCIGVTMNLTTVADENFDHMGLRTFCMFTVNSNILAAAAMAMVIPYTMDGLRTHNYYLPRWIVDVVYAAVTAVALTFLVSLFILSPAKGFIFITSAYVCNTFTADMSSHCQKTAQPRGPRRFRFIFEIRKENYSSSSF